MARQALAESVVADARIAAQAGRADRPAGHDEVRSAAGRQLTRPTRARQRSKARTSRGPWSMGAPSGSGRWSGAARSSCRGSCDPAAILSSVFNPRSTIQRYPETEHGFTLHEPDEVRELLAAAGFVAIEMMVGAGQDAYAATFRGLSMADVSIEQHVGLAKDMGMLDALAIGPEQVFFELATGANPVPSRGGRLPHSRRWVGKQPVAGPLHVLAPDRQSV